MTESTKQRQKVLFIRIPEETHRVLKSLCAREGESLNHRIKQLVIQDLNRRLL